MTQTTRLCNSALCVVREVFVTNVVRSGVLLTAPDRAFCTGRQSIAYLAGLALERPLKMTFNLCRSTGSAADNKGFTLVEILIVVIILGIVAAVALPRFSNASATARYSMLADNLRLIRMQIVIFTSQHMDVAPGYPNCDPTAAPTQEAFITYMTQSSNALGQTAAPGTPGFKFGPYFSELPPNPLNGKATVQIIADGGELPAAGDDSHGYVYKPATLKFRADSSGTDNEGKLFYDY